MLLPDQQILIPRQRILKKSISPIWFKLIKESFIIARDEWENRLQISVREGNYCTKTDKVKGDIATTNNFALKMLSDDYRE